MKSTLAAGAVLALILFFVVFNAITVVGIAEDFEARVADFETGTTPVARAEAARALYDEFLKREKYISLTVSHEDLTNIEGTFSEWIGAHEADDAQTAEEMKSRLTDAFRHLGRLAKCNFDSIF